jgi:hypothetical protein
VETEVHIALKHAAAAFLRERGARAIAQEVRCPLGRRRVDVAGYFPRSPRHASEGDSAQVGLFTGAEEGLSARDARRDVPSAWTKEQLRARTVIVECKATREDFLRDNERREDLARSAERLRERVEKVERSLRSRGPGGAPGAEPVERMLFEELEEWDYGACVSPARREIMGELAHVERKLRAETKFEEMAKYRLADCLLIAAPRGAIRKKELPDGWGLAECSTSALRAWLRAARALDGDSTPPLLSLTVSVRPRALDATPLWRERLLRHIAYALTG